MNETNANSKVEMDQAPESRDKLICPRCGKPIDPKEKKCPHCGIKNNLIRCKACGATMAKSAKSCPKCGAKNKKPFYKRVSFWLVIVIVLLMVSCSTSKDGNSSSTAETKQGAVSSSTTTSSEAATSSTESTASEVEEEQPAEESSASIGQKNALRKAQQYLSAMPFSYSGLIKQLEFEGYSTENATYAADNCDADWNEQAVKRLNNIWKQRRSPVMV